MKRTAFVAAATLLALGLPARGSESPPLTLESALASASRRPPDRLLRESGALPYISISPPRSVPDAMVAARAELMARFFDVLLVDLDESALSARMSTAYVASERLQQRKADETATLKAHHLYLDLLSRLNKTRNDQHRVRAALAVALGKPGELPGELIEPEKVSELPAPSNAEEAGGAATEAGPGGLEREFTRRELAWLLRYETARAKSRMALSEHKVDQARSALDSGSSADLGNASAEAMESLRDARSVAFAIAIARERLGGLGVAAARPDSRR